MIADAPAPAEEKKLATWGTEVPEDLVLDEKLLTEALKKVNMVYNVSFSCLFTKKTCTYVIVHVCVGQEDERRREEKDERKRKYNVRWNDKVMA